MVTKRTHPKFHRTNLGRFRRSRVADNWRRPRGIDNKQREKYNYMGKLPSIGYGNPKEIRHLHPSGLKEVIVENVSMLAGLKNVVVRIAGGVGARKAADIAKAAKAAGLRLLNYKEWQPKPKKQKKDKAAALKKPEEKKEKPEEKAAEKQAEGKGTDAQPDAKTSGTHHMPQAKQSHEKYTQDRSQESAKSKRETTL